MDTTRIDVLNQLNGQSGTRRGALGWLAGSIGALGFANVQAGKKRRGRRKNKKKFKNETRSFINDTAISIPGPASGRFGKADPYPLTLDVSGFKKGKIQDVDVTLRGITHPFPEDIDVLLVAPDGENAIILSEVGGSTDVTNVTVTLDDQAASVLSTDPLVSGTFRPTNLAGHGGADTFPGAPPPNGSVNLSTFNGGNPNGTWQLFVFDNATANNGSIGNGIQLTITAKVKRKKRKKKRS